LLFDKLSTRGGPVHGGRCVQHKTHTVS
jgi:hypothetical protein